MHVSSALHAPSLFAHCVVLGETQIFVEYPAIVVEGSAACAFEAALSFNMVVPQLLLVNLLLGQQTLYAASHDCDACELVSAFIENMQVCSAVHDAETAHSAAPSSIEKGVDAVSVKTGVFEVAVISAV